MTRRPRSFCGRPERPSAGAGANARTRAKPRRLPVAHPHTRPSAKGRLTMVSSVDDQVERRGRRRVRLFPRRLRLSDFLGKVTTEHFQRAQLPNRTMGGSCVFLVGAGDRRSVARARRDGCEPFSPSQEPRRGDGCFCVNRIKKQLHSSLTHPHAYRMLFIALRSHAIPSDTPYPSSALPVWMWYSWWLSTKASFPTLLSMAPAPKPTPA